MEKRSPGRIFAGERFPASRPNHAPSVGPVKTRVKVNRPLPGGERPLSLAGILPAGRSAVKGPIGPKFILSKSLVRRCRRHGRLCHVSHCKITTNEKTSPRRSDAGQEPLAQNDHARLRLPKLYRPSRRKTPPETAQPPKPAKSASFVHQVAGKAGSRGDAETQRRKGKEEEGEGGGRKGRREEEGDKRPTRSEAKCL